MPLDEFVEGALPDLEGFNNFGKWSGSATEPFTIGVVDRAVRFGRNQYVEIADQDEVDLGEGDFSVFVWVKTSRNGLIQSLVEKRASVVTSAPGYTLYLSSRGTPSFQMMTLSPTGAGQFENFESAASGTFVPLAADGRWHHVGVTVERNSAEGVKIYLDGQVVGSFDPTPHVATLSNSSPVWLGRHADVEWAESYLDGGLDDLVIIKRALSFAEVQELVARAAIKVPQQASLTLDNPLPTLYRGTVDISGSYTTDPALVPLDLEVEIANAAGAPTHLPIEINADAPTGSFRLAADCSAVSPGINSLRARLTDRLEQALVSPEVSFEFHLADPRVTLELTSSDLNGVYFYGRVQFDSRCPLSALQSPLVRVYVNEQLTDIAAVAGQLPGDFVFGVIPAWLQQGDNVIRVEVADPRDPGSVGSAPYTVPFASTFSLRIASPEQGATSAGHVQVFGYFENARGPVNLYSELNGRAFIEDVPLSGNQTFAFTVPAELLQQSEAHSLYLRAFDQESQQPAEAKVEFSYRPGGELAAGGDLLAFNDMEAFAQEENFRWFLNWVNFPGIAEDEKRNRVLFNVSEASCRIADALGGYCSSVRTALAELFITNGFEFETSLRTNLADIPASVKTIILYLPDSEFNQKEVEALKHFAARGGRIVYVGESTQCSDCYSAETQNNFFQQMGVDIVQQRGFTEEQLYKPNGVNHQIISGVDVIAVRDAGVFSVGDHVVPLVLSEANQVIAAIAKVNTNPYSFIQIGIDQPIDGESYARSKLPSLRGFIERADGELSQVAQITATLRSDVARQPIIWDITECWTAGADCPIPEEVLGWENTIEVEATNRAGYSDTDFVTFNLVQLPTLSLVPEPKGDDSRIGGPYSARYTLDANAGPVTFSAQINHQDGTATPIQLRLPTEFGTQGNLSFEVADAALKAGRNEIVVSVSDGYNPPVPANAVINFAAPVVTISAPQNNAAISGGAVNVQFRVGYAGIDTNPGRLPNARVSLNGTLLPNKTPTAIPTAAGIFQYAFSATELLQGNNAVDIQVADYRNSGVTGVGRVVFTYSRPTLTLNITEPSVNSTRVYTGNVTVNYTSSSPLANATFTVNGTEDANLNLAGSSSPYTYRIIGEDRLRAGQNTISIQATDASGVTAQATRTFTYTIPTITNVRLVSADGNTQTPLMGDVALSFSSNVQLAAGQAWINNETGVDLTLTDSSAPYEYTATLPGSAFRSGLNEVQVDCYDTNNVPVSGNASVNYLSTRATGSFTFGVGIGRAIIISDRIQGTLNSFPSGVNTTTLNQQALFINGVRSSFASSTLSPSIGGTSLSYSILPKIIEDNLGSAVSRVLSLTAYVGGSGLTLSGEAIVFAHRSPGARYPNSTDSRQILHYSVDGHGLMAATTTGTNLFYGGGGGNQTIQSGGGANRYYFDANSGADEITVDQRSSSNLTVGNVLNYMDLSMQDIRFFRVQSSGDLMIVYGTGYPNPFSWQLIKGYFNTARTITGIGILDGDSMPAAGSIPSYEWTDWGDRAVNTTGDIESISIWKEQRLMPNTCEPVAIQARLAGTTRILWPGDINQDSGVESFDVKSGYYCLNSLSASGRCENYQVRYLCPYQPPVIIR